MAKIFMLTLGLLAAMSTRANADFFEAKTNDALHAEFRSEVEKAGLRGAYSNSAYRLAFSINLGASRDSVGLVLRALDLQKKALDSLAQEAVADDSTVRPGNDLKTRAGLSFIRLNMMRDCRYCKTVRDRFNHVWAVNALLGLYDIQAAGAKSPRSKVKFSGLPFFALVEKQFSDPAFQERAIAFKNELVKVVERMIANPLASPETNVMEIALRVSDGNMQLATELAGIVLSRDSNIIKYFNYIPNGNRQFVEGISAAPLLVRLIVEIDKVRMNRNFDRFSYDGHYETNDHRNYYFWSSALVANELRRKGVDEQDILELNLQFARHYKILRWWEDQAKRMASILTGQKPSGFDERAYADSLRVMHMSAKGTQLKQEMTCRDLFSNQL